MKEDRNDKNIGRKLDGRYEILERIGEGGMADVYRAQDVVDNKTVAVKILKKEFAENEEFLRRFRNESKAIAVLSHPNIVRVFDVGFSDRIQFIVMEYIDGITLNEYMEEQGQLDWRDAVHYVLQILRALQHAHSKGIVHRDIKPQNIMMLQDGTIKVMDFGIAKFAREDGKTGTDKAIGTVHYISPEQARGAVTDAKSDIYSTGVMLYEMLTGKKPFDTDNPVSIAVMHMQAEAALPHTIRPDIQTGLEEIILKAMQKDPKDRYQSAREMMDDIETFKENPDGCVFGYFPTLLGTPAKSGSDEGKTKFFTPVDQPPVERSAPAADEEPEYYDDDDDEDEEYEEEDRPSFFVPILSAVIIVVILVAAIFFTTFILDSLRNSQSENNMKDTKMPGLIGMDYEEARLQYGTQLQLTVEEVAYSDQEKDKIFYQSIPEGDPIAKGERVSLKVSLGSRRVIIPDVKEWDYEIAQMEITSRGLKVEKRTSYNDTIVSGKVISTDPPGATEVDPGSFVIITVSRGENKHTVAVPTFVGLTIEEATSIADSCDLIISKEEVNSKDPAGKVIFQNISPTEQVTEGTTIQLQVSNGIPKDEEVKIPFAIPENAKGRFHITLYEEGVAKVEGPSFDVEYALGGTSVTVKGIGRVDLIARLTNDTTGASTTIGSYTVNFDTKSVTNANADITRAFRDVDGIVEVSTPSTAATDSTGESTGSTSRTWWSRSTAESTTVSGEGHSSSSSSSSSHTATEATGD